MQKLEYTGIAPKEYLEKKKKGLVVMSKVGDSFAQEVKKFDPETGELSKPEIYAVSLETMQAKKKALQQEIADIDLVIADMLALDAKKEQAEKTS